MREIDQTHTHTITKHRTVNHNGRIKRRKGPRYDGVSIPEKAPARRIWKSSLVRKEGLEQAQSGDCEPVCKRLHHE